MTPREQADYEYLKAKYETPTASASPVADGLLTRLGKQTANLPGSVLEGFMGSGTGIANMFAAPDEQTTPLQIPKIFDVAAPQTFGEKAVDFGVGLAGIGAQIAVPEAGIARGLSALGAGATLARTGAAIGGWGLTGAEHGPGEAALQGGMGGTFAASQMLPAKARVPLALLGGALGYAEGSQRSPLEGTIMAGVNTLLPFAEPALAAALSHTKKVNAISAASSGAIPTTVARPSGINLTEDAYKTGVETYGANAIETHDVFGRRPLPPPDVSSFPVPGEAPIAPDPLRLATGSSTNGGIPFYEPAPNGLHIVGQKGIETPGWEQGPIPLSPSRQIMPGSLDPSFPGPIQTGEEAFGGQPGVFDAFRPPERNGIPPIEPVATLQTPKTHPLESLTPKVQKLLADNGIAKPGELPTDITGDAFRLSSMLKTKADLNQLKNASKKITALTEEAKANGGVESDLVRELDAKGQLLTEAIEHAEGLPAKMDVFKRFDPSYEPRFPSKASQSFTARGGFELPKKGDTVVHWGEGDMPHMITVIKVSKTKVEYESHDPISGESTFKTSTPEEFATLQKHSSERPPPPPANPSEPVEPAAVTPPESQPSNSFQSRKVWLMENGKRVEAIAVAKEGDTLTLSVNDPIRGERTTFALESEVHPLETNTGTTVPKGGVPFQDVPGAKSMKSKSAGDFDDLDDILRGRDAAKPLTYGEDGEPIYAHDIPDINLQNNEDELLAYLQRYKSQSIGQAAKELDGLGGIVMKDMLQRILVASGHPDFPVRITASDNFTRIGLLSLLSGKIELDWGNIRGVLRNWPTMSEGQRATSILKLTKLLGHEIGHASVRLGKSVGLEINGRNLTDAIDHEVMRLPLTTRQFIAGEIKEAVGETGAVSNYLAGDIDTVWSHYRQKDSTLTKEVAQKMAAEEFMVELMSIELHKRMEVRGLTGVMRAAVDKLKNVMRGILSFFGKQKPQIAALQNLQGIAREALDKFAAADDVTISKAFPSSSYWQGRAQRTLDKGIVPKDFVEPTDPMDWITLDYASGHPPAPATSEPFLKAELMRIGIRTVGGALVGGFVAPTVTSNQISVSEGVLLGGVLSAFGPAVARRILNSDLSIEAGKALVAGKGNPLKSLEVLMGGKTLKQLGGEALFTERNGVARMVRALEVGLGINFDKNLRGVLEHSRGLAAEQMAVVWDALKRAKDFDSSPALKIATLQFLEGKLDGPSFVRGLGTAEEKAFGTLITTARAATDNLQQMFASGLKEGGFKKQVLDSVGSYVGKFYSAYTKGEFNMEAYAKAKADLKTAFPDYSNDVADSIMHQYMREVKTERSIFGRVSGSGQQLDPALWKRRLATDSEIEAQQAILDSMTVSDLDYRTTKDKLTWMQSHKVTDGYAEWLGEIKDPKERILRTFQKLYASSISGKTFDLLSESLDSIGLKFSYGAEELSKLTLNGAARLARLAPESAEFATLQKQLGELKFYVPLPTGAQYGKLSGKMVSRFVRDQISTETSPFRWMEQPVFRAISEFNNFIKVGRTAFNPITVIRNYLQMPLFGLIAKTNMTDLTEAWRHMNAKGDLYKLFLREGITTADMSVAEMTDGPGRLFSGFFDADAATRMAAQGVSKALDIYRAPDAVLRAGTFLSAMKRFSKGDLIAGLADPDIVRRAVAFTNRYTMNYHAVSPIIKVARQLPFVSLFLSYTTEITRILANLTHDAVNPGIDSAGRIHALGVLGGMATIPALMVSAGENSLSAKDRKEWDKVKALSPNYSRSRFRIPLYRDTKGAFHYADLTNLLPADAYSMMVKAIAAGDFEAAAAVNPLINLTNTPLLTIATEQIAGKDIQTGQAIRGLDRARAVLKEILPPITPAVGYEAERIQNAFTPNAAGGLGLTNARTGRSVMPSDIVLNYLTGMKFANVSPTTIERGYISEAKQRIAEEQQHLRQVTATDVAPAAKAAAVERFNSAVKEIMLDMHGKMHLGD